jgi:UDP-glucose 4-epimerase
MSYKVLVLGGDSYIASNFIQLIRAESDLMVYSRVETGCLNETVVTDFFSLTETNFFGADVVVNFVGIAHRKNVPKEDYDKVNNRLAVYLCENAKRAGVKHFIQMSTISVYGNFEEIDENTNPNPVNEYGQSKLNADNLLQSINTDSFKVSIIRPPMVYGNKCPGNFFKLVNLVSQGWPLPLGNADENRDFIFVANLVSFIKHIAFQPTSGVFLISDGCPISTKNLVVAIAHYKNIRLRLFPVPKILIRLLVKVFPGVFSKLFGRLSVSIVSTLVKTNFKVPFDTEESLRRSLL